VRGNKGNRAVLARISRTFFSKAINSGFFGIFCDFSGFFEEKWHFRFRPEDFAFDAKLRDIPAPRTFHPEDFPFDAKRTTEVLLASYFSPWTTEVLFRKGKLSKGIHVIR
jgi:hypothetical protein